MFLCMNVIFFVCSKFSCLFISAFKINTFLKFCTIIQVDGNHFLRSSTDIKILITSYWEYTNRLVLEILVKVICISCSKYYSNPTYQISWHNSQFYFFCDFDQYSINQCVMEITICTLGLQYDFTSFKWQM